jgi:hypothetical protein
MRRSRNCCPVLTRVSVRSRVLSRTSLQAKYGVNKFVVKPAPHVLASYPDHVRHATFYGRLASAKFIVNLDMSLVFNETVHSCSFYPVSSPHYRLSIDPQLGGYVGLFDLRDSDVYTLQVVIGWYFGDSSPKDLPKPLLVGGHMGHQYSSCSLQRSLVSGSPISVYLSPEDVKPASQSMAKKCRSGDGLGRWVSFAQRQDPCVPPLCTGNRQETVNKQDWVGDVAL